MTRALFAAVLVFGLVALFSPSVPLAGSAQTGATSSPTGSKGTRPTSSSTGSKGIRPASAFTFRLADSNGTIHTERELQRAPAMVLFFIMPDCPISPVSYTHLRAHETPEHL